MPKTATQKEIKAKYYELAKKYHPDVNKSPDAKGKFAEINSAYEVLSDEAKRQRYDSGGGMGFEDYQSQNHPGMADINDMLNQFFRSAGGGGGGFGFGGPGGGGGRLQGEDVQVSISISLKEALLGINKTVNFRAHSACKRCDGKGVHLPPDVKKNQAHCKRCNGTGMKESSIGGAVRFATTCSECGGSGLDKKYICHPCDGQGVVEERKTTNIDIPPGIETGMALRCSNLGGAGTRGGRPGDLIVVVQVQPDRVFRRNGINLERDFKIPYTTAILGGDVNIDGLTGMKQHKIPPGSQFNSTIRVRDGGFADLNSGGKRKGDFVVNLQFDIPSSLTPRQKELFQELAAIDGHPIPSFSTTSTSSTESTSSSTSTSTTTSEGEKKKGIKGNN